MKRLLPLAAILILSSAGPAQAGLFDDAEARRQITNIRQDLEGRLETTSRGQLELANQNEQLRAEVARLRGQIELLVNEVETLKQRQRDFYVDLDTRLRQMESGAPPAAAGASADPAAESAEYEAALNLLKDGKHREALTAFDAFLARFRRQPAPAPISGPAMRAQAKDINAAQALRDRANKCPTRTSPLTPCSASPTASSPSVTPQSRAVLAGADRALSAEQCRVAKQPRQT